MRKIISTNINMLVIPVFGFLALLIVGIFIGRIFLDKLSEQNTKLEVVSNEERILQQKLSSLQSVGQVVNLAQNASDVLPADNPSFLVLSQLKRYAVSLQVTVDNLQVGQEIKSSSLSHVDINFDLNGSFSAITSFLEKLRTAAPITNVTNINLSQKGAESRASITMSAYWSAFPDKLPAISESFKELTPDENKVLSQVASYEKPIILGTQGEESTAGTGKIDPFTSQ